METKRCAVCDRELPKTSEYFYIRKDNKDGFRNDCKQCYRQRVKEYSKHHKEAIATYVKRRRLQNEECLKIYKKEYYQAHRSVVDAKHKQYREKHIEQSRATSRRWAQANKDKRRISKQRRKAKKRSLPATLTVEQWEQIKSYFNNRCAYCGRKLNLTQDHFVPLGKNGAYTQENIIPACKTCNSSKQDKDFMDWYPTYKYFSEERAENIVNYIDHVGQI